MTDPEHSAKSLQKGLTLEEVRDALAKNGGIMTLAANDLGVATSTVSRWVTRHPELETTLAEADHRVSDLAEAVIVNRIVKDKDPNFAWKWLERRSPRFMPKNEVTGKDGAPLFDPSKYTAFLAGLTDEQRAAFEGLGERPGDLGDVPTGPEVPRRRRTHRAG